MNTPTHAQISERAYQIWQEGSLGGAAIDIWLEAERQLTAELVESRNALHEVPHTLSESQSEDAKAQQASQQRKDARAPQRATHTGPKSAPAESGKPLWSKPHSS